MMKLTCLAVGSLVPASVLVLADVDVRPPVPVFEKMGMEGMEDMGMMGMMGGDEEEEAAPAPSWPCVDAEPQAPRDVSVGASGNLAPRTAVIPLSDVPNLVHVNTHFHLGAEHRSAGQYDIEPDTKAEGIVPGFMCDTSSLTSDEMLPYDFQHCHDVEVGKSYEFHWVRSSHGSSIGPGLGGAFARGLNPLVAVQAQVFYVANMGSNHSHPNLAHEYDAASAAETVSYMGSTTGTSWDNEYCSPLAVSWHVDPQCHCLSAASLDEMCRVMKEDYGAEADAHPHNSRTLVSEDWVVPETAVTRTVHA